MLDLCLRPAPALRLRRFVVPPYVSAHPLYNHASTYLAIQGFLFDPPRERILFYHSGHGMEEEKTVQEPLERMQGSLG